MEGEVNKMLKQSAEEAVQGKPKLLLSALLLHHVNTRLQHLLDCKLPFGGLIVILAGNFHQRTTVRARWSGE
jgi:hypothetical protein